MKDIVIIPTDVQYIIDDHIAVVEYIMDKGFSPKIAVEIAKECKEQIMNYFNKEVTND